MTELMNHMPVAPDQSIGVVVVTFSSADVIAGCLDSLVAQDGARPTVVVVDNASTDTTLSELRAWAAARCGDAGRAVMQEIGPGVATAELDGPQVILLHSGANRGFAGGVNLGLALLARRPGIKHFWILNPDACADPKAAQSILAAARQTPDYGMMSGRICYAEPPFHIQSDGGTINWWTGVTGNINARLRADTAVLPDARVVDFVCGANMVASRRFYETVGPMQEDYFLYYEEVDWAVRGGVLPLIVAPGFVAHHHAGTSIGSQTPTRIATPFSIWFLYRGRMRFVRRFHPLALPITLAYATAKAGQLFLKGAYPQAVTLLGAIFGLPAPKAIRSRLSAEAGRIAFGKARQ